jgi:zinc transporter 1/2/3
MVQVRADRRAEEDHDGHDHGDDDGHDHGDSDENKGGSTLVLRVTAIFVTAVVTALGLSVFFTRLSKVITPDFLLCLRAFSAGSMISVALVHILPESSHALEGTTNYPLAAALVLLGLQISYTFENLGAHESHKHVDPGFESTGAPQVVQQIEVKTNQVQEMETALSEDTENVTIVKAAISSSRIAVESMEVGCVMHSLVLGLALGMQTNLRTASVLLIVFLLHQLLEALCLSHLVASLASFKEKLIMCVATVLSMPLGIVVGLAISLTANAKDKAKQMAPVTASLAAIAGGMLLYSSMIDIIATDLKHKICLESYQLRVRMCLCMLFGLSAMSSLAAGEVAIAGPDGHAH